MVQTIFDRSNDNKFWVISPDMQAKRIKNASLNLPEDVCFY